MRKRTLTVIGIVCLSLQATPLFSAPNSQALAEQELATQFAGHFSRQIAEAKVMGAAFAVATPKGIIRVGTAGYTDTSRKQAINENTVFRVASVSKTFAAGLTGVLVDEGQFSWEDPVVSYVPDFRINGNGLSCYGINGLSGYGIHGFSCYGVNGDLLPLLGDKYGGDR